MNSKQVIDLSVTHKALKLPEDNIGENLGDFRYGDVFLDTIPKAQSIREIIDKMDIIKI